MLEQGHQEECGEQLGTKDCRLGQVHCLRPLGLAQFLFMEMSQSCNAQPSVVLVAGGGFSDEIHRRRTLKGWLLD